MIKYSYAFLEDKYTLIHINDINKDSRYEHSYYCVSCGHEMIPNLGDKNQHYFSHKAGTDGCNSETYLHKLAKRILLNKFYAQNQFYIALRQDHQCSDKDKCKLYDVQKCHHQCSEFYDLKQHYNACSEEMSVKNFVADLCVYNTDIKNQEPVLIEICVTHPCTEEKKKSGLRIIEIQIHDEDDINYIKGHSITRNIAEFYNFRVESANPIKIGNVPIIRFALFESGAALVNSWEDEITCNYRNKRIYAHSILELNMPYHINSSFSAYQLGLAYAKRKGINIKNCNLCKHHQLSDVVFTEICTIHTIIPNQKLAKVCKDYCDISESIKIIDTIEEV